MYTLCLIGGWYYARRKVYDSGVVIGFCCCWGLHMLGPGSWGCINGKVLRYHPAILYPWGMVGYTLTVPAACLVGLGYRAGYGVDRVAGWYAWGRVAWGWLGMQGPSYQGDQGTQQQPPADTRHNPSYQGPGMGWGQGHVLVLGCL